MPRLVLASASPRRSQLLRDLGLSFALAPTQAEEPDPTPHDGANPHLYVERLAQIKALACLEDGLILSADTVVVFENEILNKPRDAEEAFAMLCRLRGKTHQVFTGVCIRDGDQLHLEHERTFVTFGDVSDEWVRAYVATGEPLDKAGAYGAQGRGAMLVARIEGDYFNVVGLPLFRVTKMLASHGIHVWREWQSAANAGGEVAA